jgi:type I restriction enzyme S subunit
MKEEMLCEVSLGDVIQPRRQKVSPADHVDQVYIGLEHIEPHTMKLIGVAKSGDMVSTANKFFKGDVLYSRLRPYLNKVFEADRDGLCSAEFIVFPASAFINSTFLKYRLNAADFVEFANSLNAGDRPRVDFEQISSFKFLLPSSLAQSRIVEKLEELLSDLDAGVAELKAARKKLGQYRQSLLKAAVEGALTAEWREERKKEELRRKKAGDTTFLPSSFDASSLLERILLERRARWEAKQLAKFKEQGKTPLKDWQKKYLEPVQPDASDLPALPEGWVWASVDQLIEFITSGSRGWADYYSESGATFIRSQNINKDWLDLSEIACVNPPSNSEGARTRVQRHDLLLTITGANVGKAARVDTDLDEAYVSQHVALIRPVEIEISDFLHLFLTASAGGRGQLNKEAYGAGKPGLNLQQVGAVSIPLPGMPEIRALMDAVAMQLQAVTEQEQVIVVSLKQSTAQRQNILRAAFSGQLVPQDPTDEPASVLLERIRAERAAHAAVKKPRGRKVREATA